MLRRPGRTSARYASTIGGTLNKPGHPHWSKGMGQVPDDGPDVVEDCPWWDPFCDGTDDGLPTLPGSIPGLPTTTPPTGVPGLVLTEQECKDREQAAYLAGQQAERSNLITSTLITAAVTAVVAGGIGYFMRR